MDDFYTVLHILAGSVVAIVAIIICTIHTQKKSLHVIRGGTWINATAFFETKFDGTPYFETKDDEFFRCYRYYAGPFISYCDTPNEVKKRVLLDLMSHLPSKTVDAAWYLNLNTGRIFEMKIRPDCHIQVVNMYEIVIHYPLCGCAAVRTLTASKSP